MSRPHLLRVAQMARSDDDVYCCGNLLAFTIAG